LKDSSIADLITLSALTTLSADFSIFVSFGFDSSFFGAGLASSTFYSFGLIGSTVSAFFSTTFDCFS